MNIIKKRLLLLSIFVLVLIFSKVVTASEEEQWQEKVHGQIAVGKNEFLIGEQIYIKIDFINTGNEPVYIADPIFGGFDFSALDTSGKSVKKLNGPDILSRFYRRVPIHPDIDHNDVVYVKEYLDFPGPGVYTVSCSGKVLIHKGLPKNQSVNEEYISLTAVITIKLREGSATELETSLREYLAKLKSGNRRTQRKAAFAFTISEPELAVKLLKETLEGKKVGHASYVSSATWALAKIGTAQAIQALSDVAMNSTINRARVAAILEFGKWRIEESVPTLTGLLSDPYENIRIAALRSLGDIGIQSSVSAVEQKLNDSSENVRKVAEKVYKKLTEGSKNE